MTLIERYLAAVAAQLPKSMREDVTAELRDDILSRMEAREAELGRPLSEADEEAVLREVGHPLVVAGRFRPGPQHLVGPELYPWWLFAVKAGLIVLACIVALGAAITVVVGEVTVGEAFGEGMRDLFNGAVMIIGLATVGGFILERQTARPRFLSEWRVKDLDLFRVGGLDTEPLERSLNAEPAGRTARPVVVRVDASTMSPTARALASAAAWVVLLLWWVGAVEIGASPAEMGATVGGVDYQSITRSLAAWLYWPVIGYGVGRIAFDLFRASRPGAVRLIALGDLGLASARMAMLLWVWTSSALSPVVRVDTVQELVERGQGLFEGRFGLGALLTLIVAGAILETAGRIAISLWRLMAGRETR
jgi:hypothetical protein